ncbi:MAG: hypothetical protein AAGC93_15365 [Cyanobacteria bacterium P01_F01_bin.53]
MIVWADDTTQFLGEISATGGEAGGNGGFVEVSGKQNLIFRGEVDTHAAQGRAGTLLLDPENIIIADGSGAANDGELVDGNILSGEAGTSTFTISEQALESLNGNTALILEASNDIIVRDLSDNELRFSPGSGNITFTADADMSGAGSFLMEGTNDTLFTNARSLNISGVNLRLGNLKTAPSIEGFSLPPRAGAVNLQASGMVTVGTINTQGNIEVVPESPGITENPEFSGNPEFSEGFESQFPESEAFNGFGGTVTIAVDESITTGSITTNGFS